MNSTDVEELGDIKAIVISAVLITNIVVNSLTIAVLVRYPELREDRTALFMISLSVSDLAVGCLTMPISAAVCSSATPSVRHMSRYLPEIHIFFMWCFSFNSLHSLCWMTVSKMYTLLKPLHHDLIFTRRRCYGIIACNWIIGAAVGASKLGIGTKWTMIGCTSVLRKSDAVSVMSLLTYAVMAVLPGVVLVYSTLRILGIVVRAQTAIATQVMAVLCNQLSCLHTCFFITSISCGSSRCDVVVLVSLLFVLLVSSSFVLYRLSDVCKMLQTETFLTILVLSRC